MVNAKAVLFFFLALLFSLSTGASVRDFNIDKSEGVAPSLITFDASGIKQAKKFIWTFGDGGSLTTTKSVVTYQYKSSGIYNASLVIQMPARKIQITKKRVAFRL